MCVCWLVHLCSVLQCSACNWQQQNLTNACLQVVLLRLVDLIDRLRIDLHDVEVSSSTVEPCQKWFNKHEKNNIDTMPHTLKHVIVAGTQKNNIDTMPHTLKHVIGAGAQTELELVLDLALPHVLVDHQVDEEWRSCHTTNKTQSAYTDQPVFYFTIPTNDEQWKHHKLVYQRIAKTSHKS